MQGKLPHGLICSVCHQSNAPGALYCAHCGEPFDPGLIAELQRLHTVLLELDAQIAMGKGGVTVQELRDVTRDRYLSQRAPRRAGQQTPASAPGSAPPPVMAPTTAPLPAPTGVPAMAAAVAAPIEPHGPVFTWRAFIAEQAIAVMAYLGGFLLIIATLTFVVGGWQALPDGAKLAGVLAAYLIFGALGVALRRSASLRTVSRVYLGVFALMTPLAALAVYRFELQSQGFPVSGTICLAAAYTCIVYFALAIRTRFITYAYLTWGALLVAALAIPPWAALDTVWWVAVLNLVALALLALHFLRARGRGEAWLEIVEPSATQFSGGLALLGALTTLIFSLQAVDAALSGLPNDQTRAAIAVAACTLVPLSLAWGQTARHIPVLARPDWLATLDWFSAATVPVAAVSVAAWRHADLAQMALTLTLVALGEGALAETLRQWAPHRHGVRIGVQTLAAALATIAVALVIGRASPNTPLIVASLGVVTLGLVFALRGSPREVFPWGLLAGIFLLIGGQAVFDATLTSDALTSESDQLPAALTQSSTLHGLLALALVALGLLLNLAPTGSQVRRLRAPVEVTALIGAVVASLLLTGHTRDYAALFLGVFAVAALVVSRVERQPLLAGACATVFGVLSGGVFIVTNLNGVAVALTPIALALVMLALGRALGRAYSIPVYIATLSSVFLAFLQLLSVSEETTAHASLLALSVGGWMALAVALALTVEVFTTRPSAPVWGAGAPGMAPQPPLMAAPPTIPLSPAAGQPPIAAGPITVPLPTAAIVRSGPSPFWMIAPALVALMASLDAHNLWTLVALTLAMVGAGSLLRFLRGAQWDIAWQGAAALVSVLALDWTVRPATFNAPESVGVALLFVLVAYALAWQTRTSWRTVFVAPYALFAFAQIGALAISEQQQLAMTFGLAVVFALAGMASRIWLGRGWSLAPYAVAVAGSIFTAARVTPYPQQAGLLEALLLIFAALAFFAATLERTPWATLAPAAFGVAAALAQPDGRALLPLALVFAAAAFAVSRTRGGLWALSLYGAAMVAAVASVWQGRAISGGFETLALVTLALAAWALAALESRADALLVSYIFAALAVSAAARDFGWDAWIATLAFAALAWVFELSGLGWVRIPWLRERDGAWLHTLGRAAERQAAWRDPRRAGLRVARGAAALVATGVVIGGWLAPESFATHSAQTQALAVALLSLTALLARISWGEHGWRPALYLAIETAALFVSWELRWLGAENLQAWIIAPGSAQLIIGALLPADMRLRPPRWAPQAFSIAGTLVLLLPTLSQSVTEPVEWQWRYALLLAVEALALTLLAVGLRNRILALTGSAFVGVAAIRGAIIAVQQNLPVPVVIGVFALALMGLATWLSLRARRTPHAPSPS